MGSRERAEREVAHRFGLSLAMVHRAEAMTDEMVELVSFVMYEQILAAA